MNFNSDIKDVRFNVDLSTVLIIYRQYKNYFLPIGIIIISLIVFFIILIPQVQGVFSAKEEERQEMQKLESLRQSYSNLSAMNEATLDQNINALERALPSAKDFAGIINSISSNAAKAGVSVGNFEFSVGDLSKAEEGVAFPTILITLNVAGSPKATVEFIKNLYESVPIAEITSMKLSGESTNLKAQFYYKTSSPISLQNKTEIKQFSKSENALLSKVNKWSDNVLSGSLPLTIGLEEQATESSRTNPFQ